MPINRRVTSGQREAHRELFGSLETPPLGWNGEGFTFSLTDYNEAADALIKEGKKPIEAHRELGREVGPDAWTDRMIVHRGESRHFEFVTGTVFLPKVYRIKPPMVSDREFAFHEHNRIICGWWYDRMRGKGTQNTIGAWIANKIGYISQGQPHEARRNIAKRDEPPIYKSDIHFLETARCVGINPYRDFKYVGEFPRRISEFPDYVETAIKAIRDEFIRLHGASK